jgi:hypothetical protein
MSTLPKERRQDDDITFDMAFTTPFRPDIIAAMRSNRHQRKAAYMCRGTCITEPSIFSCSNHLRRDIGLPPLGKDGQSL